VVLKQQTKVINVITYATVGNVKGNSLPVDNLLFDIIRGSDETYQAIIIAIKDGLIEDFIKERTMQGHLGDILEVQLDAYLMERGMVPFNKDRFRTFMHNDEWRNSFSKSGGFLWFTITPLKEYIDQESPAWIYSPFI